MKQALRLLGAHAAAYNIFNLGRQLISAEHYRYFRLSALQLGIVRLPRRSKLTRLFINLERYLVNTRLLYNATEIRCLR
jgi:hypothetical protein